MLCDWRLVFALMMVFISWCVNAEEPKQTIQWKDGLEGIATKSDDTTRFELLVVTNDDPYSKESSLWCDNLLTPEIKQLFSVRPELVNHIEFRRIRAGLSKELSDDANRNQPSRCAVFVADNRLRLLSMLVGVPDYNELAGLIEDAEETAAFLENHKDSDQEFVTAVAERSNKRLTRIWNEELKRKLVAGVRIRIHKAGDESNASQFKALATLGETMEEMYLLDSKQRFGLRDLSDLRRLVILEQHVRTRSRWCESILPAIAGANLELVWRPLIEIVWKQPVLAAESSAAEFANWWENEIESTDRIVLAVEPAFSEMARPWPPPKDVNADSRTLGWTDLQNLLIEESYRNVTLADLAFLMNDKGLRGIDWAGPGQVRYVIYERKKPVPILIRETDSPRKHISQFKRRKN